MHKTVSVSIGAEHLIIEEDAFKSLDTYLASIRKLFRKSGDAEEIASDIEIRIGEELAAKMNKRKKVILQKDVDEVIATMGTVRDLEEFEEDDTGRSDAKFDWKKIRLYRDADDQVIGGVASGIAHYFGIDPIIVRILFGLSLFMGGFGFVLYILLWILVPEAHTSTQKVEMTKGRITLSALQERIDEVVPPQKRKTMLGKIIAFPFIVVKAIVTAILGFIRFFLPLIGRIAGFFGVMATLGATAVLTFLLFALLLNPHSPYIGLPLDTLVGDLRYAVFLIATYFLALVPFMALLFVALSLLLMQRMFTLGAAVGFAALWFAALVTAALAGFSMAPDMELAIEQYKLEYENTITQDFDLTGFDSLVINGRTHVEVTQSEEFAVQVESTRDVSKRLAIEVSPDGVLEVGEKSGTSHCIIFCRSDVLTVRVTMPSLTMIRMDGATKGAVEGFDEEEMHVIADGVARLTVTADVEAMTVEGDGASHVVLIGSGQTLDISLDGVGVVSAYDFPVLTATVDIDGPARAMIDAVDSLTGRIDGPGRVYHKSVPPILNIDIDGPGRVIRQDEDHPERW